MPFRFQPNKTVRNFCLKTKKFHPDAYYLVRHAVSVSANYIPKQSEQKHISGQNLLIVIRKVLLELYGPLTIDVLDSWNVHSTEDFGQIVFDLVGMKLLGVSEKDSSHDFDNGYDCIEAFVLPFRRR